MDIYEKYEKKGSKEGQKEIFEYRINFDPQDEKCSLSPVSEKSNGFEKHLGKRYSPKGLFDILRRTAGQVRGIDKDEKEKIKAILYDCHIFYIKDRMPHSVRKIENALENEQRRDKKQRRSNKKDIEYYVPGMGMMSLPKKKSLRYDDTRPSGLDEYLYYD